jgi:hypothetical protein
VQDKRVVFTRTVYLKVARGGHSDDHQTAKGENHNDHDDD